MALPYCTVCGRDPKRVNNSISECSHGECPHRPGGPWVVPPVETIEEEVKPPVEVLFDDPEAADSADADPAPAA